VPDVQNILEMKTVDYILVGKSEVKRLLVHELKTSENVYHKILFGNLGCI